MRLTLARWLPLMFVISVTSVLSTQGPASADEQRLMQLERDAAQAILKGDIAFFERFSHPDYTNVTPAGKLSTRSEDMEELKSGAFKAESMAVDELKVRI